MNKPLQMNPLKTFAFLLVVLMLAISYKHHNTIIGLMQKNKDNSHEKSPITSNYSADTTNFSDSIQKTIFAKNIDTDSLTNNYFVFPKHDTILNSFFKEISKSKDSKIRIIYYGDSQIEGDHITYTLRKQFQKKFGGNGIGFMPAEMYFNATEKVAVITNDFKKTIVTNPDKEKRDYGIYGQYFTPLNKSNTIRINNRSENHQYNNVRILCSGKADLQYQNDQNNVKEIKINNETQGVVDLNFDQTPKQLKLIFSQCDSFVVYGILIESNRGVYVDHVPFRGNLNLISSRFDMESFKKINNIIQPSMIIMHFGLNLIRDRRESYNNYRIALENDICNMQKNSGNIPIVVIGVSDMAYNKNGHFVSYENIDEIIRTQRNAAHNCNAVFWDMHNAMGGKNSIVKWVEKGWARSDYAHFTNLGGEQIGKILFDNFMTQYNSFFHTLKTNDISPDSTTIKQRTKKTTSNTNKQTLTAKHITL